VHRPRLPVVAAEGDRSGALVRRERVAGRRDGGRQLGPADLLAGVVVDRQDGRAVEPVRRQDGKEEHGVHRDADDKCQTEACACEGCPAPPRDPLCDGNRSGGEEYGVEASDVVRLATDHEDDGQDDGIGHREGTPEAQSRIERQPPEPEQPDRRKQGCDEDELHGHDQRSRLARAGGARGDLPAHLQLGKPVGGLPPEVRCPHRHGDDGGDPRPAGGQDLTGPATTIPTRSAAARSRTRLLFSRATPRVTPTRSQAGPPSRRARITSHDSSVQPNRS